LNLSINNFVIESIHRASIRAQKVLGALLCMYAVPPVTIICFSRHYFHVKIVNFA